MNFAWETAFGFGATLLVVALLYGVYTPAERAVAATIALRMPR